MKKTIRIGIEKPCQENWWEMNPNEKGRHCRRCDKTVHDFTGMSKEDLFAFFKDYKGGSICGRIREEHNGMVLCERPVIPHSTRIAGLTIAGMVLASSLLMLEWSPPIFPPTHFRLEQVDLDKANQRALSPFPVRVTVIDKKSGLPIANAKGRISGEYHWIETNEDGKFEFFVPEDLAFGIELESDGYDYFYQYYHPKTGSFEVVCELNKPEPIKRDNLPVFGNMVIFSISSLIDKNVVIYH